ncbi:MAG TPA: sulfotransferase family protein, partial [Hellea balneolensis]|nr:sulfotransferase family protein [Hellea balneolensis]
MSLKIIGAGFGRTGTLSLKAALERLGYIKTHHMLEVLPSKKQISLWLDVAQGKPPHWNAIFDGYAACVDAPSSHYYKELMAHYHDAKVILTTRDPDKWYHSTAETIYAFKAAVPNWSKKYIPRIRQIAEMIDGTVWQRVFHGRFEDESYAKQVFKDHIHAVKANVPAEKLLVFDVKQGWEPLCAFLGCDIPHEPFPHLNDAA